MSTTETLDPVGTWSLDPVHSSIGFEVAYLGGTFKGQFRDVDARLDVADGSATLEGTAEVASVDVKDEALYAHLQSPEFFDAERYPQLRFTARDLSLDGETVTVEGDLTIKGSTRPVEVRGTRSEPFVDQFGRERIALTLSTTVDRTAFGLDWNAELPTGEPALADEVTVVADLVFLRAE